ncbi:MAG: hypothetical protein CL472_01230 [Acidobacteria bacterium]|nr:hypothetical protein [Acidobacteriota bacterium]
MSGTLTFKVDDTLRALVAHAKSSTARKASYEQLYDETLLKEGCEPGLSESIDPDKIPAGLWLVKDRGVYLMSNGQSNLPGPGCAPNLVHYADEANPDKDPEGYYDSARRIAGGDDFVEAIDINVFEDALHHNAEEIIFTMTHDSMTIGMVLPPAKKRVSK